MNKRRESNASNEGYNHENSTRDKERDTYIEGRRKAAAQRDERMMTNCEIRTSLRTSTAATRRERAHSKYDSREKK